MERILIQLCGLNGFLAVALGAFGAHGLKVRLADLEDGAQRLDWWETAAHYHLVHALAFLACAWLAQRAPGKLVGAAAWCFQLGILLFSGSLYAMTLSGVRVLGAVTPVGGVLLLAGWLCVVLGGRRMEKG
jgi:uncharacterized membrane protein YgdD (TMEM256/DUF423 family)